MKLSPHARAIRDVEDEELRNFFYGMSPWQVKHLLLSSSAVMLQKRERLIDCVATL